MNGSKVPSGNLETLKVNYEKEVKVSASEVLEQVFLALKEKDYNPVNQIVGYMLSGDPTYITGHKNARNLIGKLERDELLEEVVKFYLHEKHGL